jgi:hypothetical protein
VEFPLAPDPSGFDFEGLTSDGRGGFWLADEYGPRLVHATAGPEGLRLDSRRVYEVLRSTGYSFKKQCRIDPYRLDFYLPEYHVCIEIDGKCHLGRSEQDNKRDRILLTYKIRTLRIPAGELYKAGYETKFLRELNNFIGK